MVQCPHTVASAAGAGQISSSILLLTPRMPPPLLHLLCSHHVLLVRAQQLDQVAQRLELEELGGALRCRCTREAGEQADQQYARLRVGCSRFPNAIAEHTT